MGYIHPYGIGDYMNYTIFDYNNDIRSGWNNIFGGVLQGANVVVNYLQQEEAYRRQIDTEKYTIEYEDKIKAFGDLLEDDRGFAQQSSDVGVTQKMGNKKVAQIGNFTLDEYDPQKYQYQTDYWQEQFTKYSESIKQEILSKVQDRKTRDFLELKMGTINQTARVDVKTAAKQKDYWQFRGEIDTLIQKGVQGKTKEEALNFIKTEYNKAYKAGMISGEEYVNSFQNWDYKLNFNEASFSLNQMKPEDAIKMLNDADKYGYKNYTFLNDKDRASLVKYQQDVITEVNRQIELNDTKTFALCTLAYNTDPIKTYKELERYKGANGENPLTQGFLGINKDKYISELQDYGDNKYNPALYNEKIFLLAKNQSLEYIRTEKANIEKAGFTDTDTGKGYKANYYKALLSGEQAYLKADEETRNNYNLSIKQQAQGIKEMEDNEMYKWQNQMRLLAYNPTVDIEEISKEILLNDSKCTISGKPNQSALFVKEINDIRNEVKTGLIPKEAIAVIQDDKNLLPSERANILNLYREAIQSNLTPDEKSPKGYKDTMTIKDKVDLAKSMVEKKVFEQVENRIGDTGERFFGIGSDTKETDKIEQFTWFLQNGGMNGFGMDEKGLELFEKSLQLKGVDPTQFRNNIRTYEELGIDALATDRGVDKKDIQMVFAKGMYMPEFQWGEHRYRMRIYDNNEYQKYITQGKKPALNGENWEILSGDKWVYWKPVKLKKNTIPSYSFLGSKELSIAYGGWVR